MPHRELTESSQRKIGAIISYISLGAGILITLFFTPFELSHLGGGGETGDIQYGLRSFVLSITSWLTILSSALSSAYIRFATQQKEENNLKTTNNTFLLFYLLICFISVVVGCLVFLLFKFNVIGLPNYSDDEKEIIYQLFAISIVSVPFSIFGSLFSNYAAFKQRFVFLRSLNLLTVVLNPLICIPFLLNSCSVVTVSCISVFISIFSFVVNVDYSLSVLKMSFSFSINKEKWNSDSKLRKEVLVFSSIVLFNVIVDEIENYIDKTTLGLMVGPQPVTLYNLGLSFSTYLTSASIAISSLFSPKINDLYVKNDMEGINKLFLRVSKLQMLVVFTAVAGFWGCGQLFVKAWIGDGKQDVYWIACVLLSLSIVPLTENISVEIQRAMNKHRFRGICYFVGGLFNIAISVVCVKFMPPQYAVYGCLIGTGITAILCKWIIVNVYYCKTLRLDIKGYVCGLLKFLILAVIDVFCVLVIQKYVSFNVEWKWGNFLIVASIFMAIWIPFVAILFREELKGLNHNKSHV